MLADPLWSPLKNIPEWLTADLTALETLHWCPEGTVADLIILLDFCIFILDSYHIVILLYFYIIQWFFCYMIKLLYYTCCMSLDCYIVELLSSYIISSIDYYTIKFVYYYIIIMLTLENCFQILKMQTLCVLHAH